MYHITRLLKEAFNLPSNINVDAECQWGDEKWHHLIEFSNWCRRNLELPDLPSIRIVASRENGMTTGAFNPATNEISVYGTNRALVDILRTLAHELTHYQQRLNDKIKTMERDWTIEGEADAAAGKMVYTYAHASPQNMGIYEL